MYFSLLPNIQYKINDRKTIIAKDIFKHYRINEDIIKNDIVFTRYSILPNQTIQDVAYANYKDRFYDWVIILTNSIINPTFALPLTENQLITSIKNEDKNPQDIAYYIDDNNIKYPKDMNVTEFTPITYLEDAIIKNDQKRILFLLKPRYFRSFVDDFEREMNKYK